MSIAIITGSAGLIGAEATRFFSAKGLQVVGIDNNMREKLFGAEASTAWSRRQLEETVPGYSHRQMDIRNRAAMGSTFSEYGRDIKVVIHTAAQPSHDWAARDPHLDFSINAEGTLVLLESARQYCPDAVFIFMSTNKVYGDNPNKLPLVELESRWEVSPEHPYREHGIDERMSLDQAKHSLFGASKLAADILVQEYGSYFGMKTVCFRGGCITGPGHSATQMHGFLAYLTRCAVSRLPYEVFGYKEKKVRDNIHAHDIVNMFWHYYRDPRPGEVYNSGGGRHSNCSVLEAIDLLEACTGNKIRVIYRDQNRIGDHIWYVSDVRKFQSHYPAWSYQYDLQGILREIHDSSCQLVERS